MLTLPAGAVNATIAAGDDDRVLIAWSKVLGGARATVEALDWVPHGSRSVVRTLGVGSSRGGFTPQAGMIYGGGALVAWQAALPGGRSLVKAVARTTGARAFSGAVGVTPARDSHDASALQLDTGTDSLLLATSESQAQGPYRATLRTWTPAAGVSGPIVLSPPGVDAFAPAAASRTARTLVAWQQDTGGRSVVAATASGLGGRFPEPSTLSDPALIVQSTSGPYVAVDNRGVALAAWIDYGGDNGSRGQVELARLAG